MVVYGSAASVSVGTLFTAGVGPGVAIGLILCIAVFIVAKRRGYTVHKRATLREVLGCIRRSFFALLLPIIIMGGIMCGYFTPTEASCIAITYCILVVCFIYRDMPVKNLLAVVDGTVSGIVPALAIVSSASLFGWVLQFEHLGEKMYNGITSITSNKWVILLIIDVILLFFGMILDSTPTIMLLVPIFQPLTKAVGISPIHLGIIVVLNLMIGLMTPPYGQSLFMLSGTTGVHFNKVVKYVMPWLLPMFIALLAITFIEPITLAIPMLLGFEVF
jgi:tripartite ATP-independent transporter DctM subunit